DRDRRRPLGLLGPRPASPGAGRPRAGRRRARGRGARRGAGRGARAARAAGAGLAAGRGPPRGPGAAAQRPGAEPAADALSVSRAGRRRCQAEAGPNAAARRAVGPSPSVLAAPRAATWSTIHGLKAHGVAATARATSRGSAQAVSMTSSGFGSTVP